MPIFEYKCQDCDQQFETLRSAQQTEPEECPACGSRQTVKQISSFAAASGQSQGPARDACACGSGGFT